MPLGKVYFLSKPLSSGADPGFVEGGGAQQRSRLKTLFGISKGGGGRRGRAPSLALHEDPLWNFKRGRAPPAPPPPESASGPRGLAL